MLFFREHFEFRKSLVRLLLGKVILGTYDLHFLVKRSYMGRTDLYLLVKSPYMGRTDLIFSEKVLKYSSSVGPNSEKSPYMES